MMYISPSIVLIMHEDRVREAQKLAARDRLISDLAEPTPIEVNSGLIYTIKQWFRPQRQERQPGTRDERRATAV